MTRAISLAWKEWHETRTYLWIAIGVFICLPLIGGLESILQYAHHFEVQMEPWVIAFGGVLAIFVAVGATCRDFNGHLEDFWQSRPVGTTQWMLTKYVVGLAIVLAACVLPLVVESAINRETESLWQCAMMPFVWTALFSLSFLAGCLVRRTAQAAMLGLAGMLLIGFLPMVLPFLSWLDASAVTGRSVDTNTTGLLTHRAIEFAVGMLVISVAALLLALMAVKKDWRVESGRKMMYGSISAAILILVSSVGFQLGTNLPILRQVDAPQGEIVTQLVVDGDHIYAVTVPDHLVRTARLEERTNYEVKLNEDGIRLEKTSALVEPAGYAYSALAYSTTFPKVGYFILENWNERGKNEICLRAFNSQIRSIPKTIPLWEKGVNRGSPTLYVWKDRLYIIGDHLATVDLSKPDSPQIISVIPFQSSTDDYTGLGVAAQFRMNENFEGGTKITLYLPPLPGVPAPQRLEAMMKRIWLPHCSESDTYCLLSNDNLCEYRLVQLTDSAATFEMVGKYEPTLLEKVFGSYVSYGNEGMQMMNGLLYISYMGSGYGVFHNDAPAVNPRISVYETRGLHPMRLVGHFAAPKAYAACPFPDGRALIGGGKLWVVGPPPRLER